MPCVISCMMNIHGEINMAQEGGREGVMQIWIADIDAVKVKPMTRATLRLKGVRGA